MAWSPGEPQPPASLLGMVDVTLAPLRVPEESYDICRNDDDVEQELPQPIGFPSGPSQEGTRPLTDACC